MCANTSEETKNILRLKMTMNNVQIKMGIQYG